MASRSNLHLRLAEFAKAKEKLVDPQKAVEAGRVRGIDGFVPLRFSFDKPKREMNILVQVTTVNTEGMVYGCKLRVSWSMTMSLVWRYKTDHVVDSSPTVAKEVSSAAKLLFGLLFHTCI